MGAIISIVFTPLALSTFLYTSVASAAFIEYYLTFSKDKITPNQSSSGPSQFNSNRINELDDSLSRARNISGNTRSAKRDSSPLDLSGDGNGQNQTPAGKSSGEENRIRFYKFLSISLSLRILFLPIERFYSDNESNINAMIVSASLPSFSWLISFTILTCFYGQVTFMATGRPNQNNFLKPVRTWVVHIVYGVYGVVVFFNRVIPILTNQCFKMLVWGMLSFFNLLLFLSMLYFGFSLATILKPNLNGGLGLRLVSMSVVCSVTFALRSIIDMLEVFNVIKGSQGYLISFQIHQLGWDEKFGRNVLGYITLELIPTILVLIFMHKSNDSNTNTTSRNSTTNRHKNVINEETAAGLESGEILPPANSNQHAQIMLESKTKQGTLFAKRSNQANIGVSMSNAPRSMTTQHQGSRPMPGSYGMKRSGSASVKGERVFLIEKSNSGGASTTYGSAQNDL